MRQAKRVIVPPQWIDERQERATLRGDVLHHVRRVMRLTTGASLVLADGAGREHQGTLTRLDQTTATVELHESRTLPREPGPRLTLLYGLARGTRTEQVLQKATELGVDRILPAICERSLARPKQLAQKRARWLTIVGQAARQSQRAWLPELAAPMSFAEALGEAGSADVRLIAALGDSQPLAVVAASLPTAEEIGLAIGPEGGFTEGELRRAEASGFVPISLGRLVLRTETAAVAMLAIAAQLAGRL